jgi:glucosamine-6-phosphate deaminase
MNLPAYAHALSFPLETSRWERIPLVIFDEPLAAARQVAREMAELIRAREHEGRYAVLGLATGSTPIYVYQELVRLHREEGLSFANVVTFNLDEYHPMAPDQAQSYHRFMRQHLFDHVDLDPRRTHLPDGEVLRADVAAACAAYEATIAAAGGIDFQLLGIGRTGHIGFNEPGSSRRSATRFIHLDRVTRQDAVKDFQNEEAVPRTAITMGVRTILQARRIVVMAFGEHKEGIVARAVEGEISADVPATFLQDHENCLMVLDRAAAGGLTRLRTPWVVGALGEMGLAWDDAMVRRAVTWLARETGKAILKLTDEDYNSHSLQDLLAEGGNAYEMNLRVFRQLQNTITGWPGGKPGVADQPRPLRNRSASVFPKRILVFSPHPGDGVRSIGGTITRLAQQGHLLHLAYQVSGSGHVKDEVVERYVDFLEHMSLDPKPGRPSPARIKAAIGHAETRGAARVCGVAQERLHFLNLPFYDAAPEGHRRWTSEDVDLTVQLLQQIQPHQIYAAADLADPHGTHRQCHEILTHALERVRGEAWFADCEAWLYRGMWMAWPIHEVDLAVPVSPDEVECKRRAVAQHESQKGPWRDGKSASGQPAGGEPADDLARAASRLFDALGLADYEAVETFHRWTLPG